MRTSLHDHSAGYIALKGKSRGLFVQVMPYSVVNETVYDYGLL
jgi:hypothetical protein